MLRTACLARAILVALLAAVHAAPAQFTPPSSDYFPMFLGSTWTYEAVTGNLLVDLAVETNALELAGTRTSFGHTARVVPLNPTFPDQTTEYRSMGIDGIYVDRTCLQRQFGPPFCIDFNGLRVVGPVMEVGAVQLLGRPVTITLGDPVPTAQWNGNGSGSSSILARETITVPAGTFDTFKIRFTFGYNAVRVIPNPAVPENIMGFEDTTLWVAAGVGIVKQVSNRSADLITAYTGTRTLKNFHINGPRSTLTGRILENGSALPGIDVQLITAGNLVGLTTTADDGTFTFFNRNPGSYEVRPVHPDYTFAPEQRTVLLNDDTTLDDFAATLPIEPLEIRPYSLPDGFGFAWDSETGLTYLVEQSSDGSSWQDSGEPPQPGTGGELRFERTWAPGTRPDFRLYRLQATRN